MNTIEVYQDPVKIVLNPEVVAKIVMFWITFTIIFHIHNRFNKMVFS